MLEIDQRRVGGTFDGRGVRDERFTKERRHRVNNASVACMMQNTASGGGVGEGVSFR